MSTRDSRLDLADSGQNGVYFVTREDLEAIALAANDQSLSVSGIDLGECRDRQALLACMAEELRFPATFGGNWDALADCLKDLEWLPARGHVLLFRHGDDFGNAHGEDFDELLDILDEAGDFAAAHKRPLFAFFALPDAAFANTPDVTD